MPICCTKSWGGQYQEMYGGISRRVTGTLSSLFKVNQISTGVPIDGSVKITEWAAKYFNGSASKVKVLDTYCMGSNKYFKVV